MLKKVSIILFIASIIAPILTFCIACLIGNVRVFGLAGMSYLWIAFLFIVIPLSSLIFGIVLIIKCKIKMIKNVIVGSISCIFMVSLGLTGINAECDQSGSFLRETSLTTGIVFPLNTRSMSYHYYDGRIGNALILDDEERVVFEQETTTSRWKEELSIIDKGILPSSFISTIGSFNSFSLFVQPTNEFNPKELNDGIYNVTFIAYKKEAHQILIFDSYIATIS